MNFIQGIPNSAYFTKLSQIIEYVKILQPRSKFADEFMNNLENTKREGYELVKIRESEAGE